MVRRKASRRAAMPSSESCHQAALVQRGRGHPAGRCRVQVGAGSCSAWATSCIAAAARARCCGRAAKPSARLIQRLLQRAACQLQRSPPSPGLWHHQWLESVPRSGCSLCISKAPSCLSVNLLELPLPCLRHLTRCYQRQPAQVFAVLPLCAFACRYSGM